MSQFVSELGAKGAPDGAAVSWLGFFPVGALALLTVVFAAPALAPFRRAVIGVWLVGGSYALGWIGSAAARCDPGCPDAGGSASQQVHFGVSALEILGVVLGLLLIGFALRSVPGWNGFRRLSVIVGAIAFVASGLMLTESVSASHGAIQRVFEAATLTWFVALGVTAARRGETLRLALP